MSETIKGMTVAFKQDMRQEQADAIAKAVKQIRGVEETMLSIDTLDDWIARQQITHELQRKLYEALRKKSE